MWCSFLQRIERFRVVVEAVDPELAATMEWHRATLFMEPRPGVMAIFMYQGSPGAFRVLMKTEQRKTGKLFFIFFFNYKIYKICCTCLSGLARTRIVPSIWNFLFLWSNRQTVRYLTWWKVVAIARRSRALRLFLISQMLYDRGM